MNWLEIATELKNISLALDCYCGNGGYAGPKAISLPEQALLLRAIATRIQESVTVQKDVPGAH